MWISTQTATDLLAARTAVRTEPTTKSTSSGAQACANWLSWRRAKAAPVTATAGTTPVHRDKAGERKPRKNNTSTTRAIKIPNSASAKAEERSWKNSRKGTD